MERCFVNTAAGDQARAALHPNTAVQKSCLPRTPFSEKVIVRVSCCPVPFLPPWLVPASTAVLVV